jgi:hypothetical protein
MTPNPSRHTFLIGIIALLMGIALVLLPLLLGHSDANKYLIVAGFLAICWGVCCLLLGSVEWLFAKRG